MKKTYAIRHEFDGGQSNIYFETEMSFAEIEAMVDPWGEFKVSPVCQKLCDALDINFEPWKNEFLTLYKYNISPIIDLDKNLNR